MNESLFLLITVNVLVLALLVLILIFSRLHWGVKFLLLILVSASYWIAYQGWDKSQGWPSSNRIPQKFLLHGAIIEEPDKEKGVSGTIYLWLSSLTEYRPSELPRAYVIPYNKRLHKASQEALRQMRNGELQLGTVLPEQSVKHILDGAAGEIPTLIEFSNLPKQSLPEK